MEKFNERRAEKQEGPFEADLRVDFLRHGQPSYTEEELKTAEFEGKLTKDGAEQVRKTVEKLADGIDHNRELVIIWESTKNRARQTAKIVEEVFKQKEIPVLRSSAWKSLRDIKATPEFFSQVKEAGASNKWMEYWTETEDLSVGTETPADVKRRTSRVIANLERAARTVHPEEGRKLHFIIPSHEETARDLLEEAYGTGTKAGTGPIYGETMRVDIHKSENDKDAVLELSYAGHPNAELGFEKNERKFYKRQ